VTPQGFRHEALMYASRDDFLAGTLPFIRDGVAAGEPVLVVLSREKIDLLRSALGDETAGLVAFADMMEVGANPARIIPAWRKFVDDHGAGGRPVRGIGEPIWKGRGEDELAECQLHESLLNVAFGSGQPWCLLCPYDTASLDESVIAEARRSHEYVCESGGSAASADFRGFDRSADPFGKPLPDPPSGARRIAFDRDRLLKVRREVMRFAGASSLGSSEATCLATAVNEVATNSVVHGGGKGTLRMWPDGDAVVCEISDAGSYDRALADRVRPGDAPGDARGLWTANQLCDLVQIRTFSDATVVRLHMKAAARAAN
jgi:anti-sigma regulatory factor (Ser/Thr protein kinase)